MKIGMTIHYADDSRLSYYVWHRHSWRYGKLIGIEWDLINLCFQYSIQYSMWNYDYEWMSWRKDGLKDVRTTRVPGFSMSAFRCDLCSAVISVPASMLRVPRPVVFRVTLLC
jgi:hypothetical protein